MEIMNKWQQHYINTLHNGKKPRNRAGKVELELLGNVKETVKVYFPDFNGANGFKPAHTEEYKVTLSDCNMPKGIISVEVLSKNLSLWMERGYKIEY